MNESALLQEFSIMEVSQSCLGYLNYKFIFWICNLRFLFIHCEVEPRLFIVRHYRGFRCTSEAENVGM